MRIRYDRGTLVIDQAPHELDPKQFLQATWDDELAAWRAPADRLSEIRGRLSAANVRVTDAIAPPDIPGQWSLPELRWYQHAALAAWRDAGDRGVIVLPTGAGKTLVALAAIAALRVATLVLVPTRILLDQWARALAAAYPHPIGRLGDGDRHIAPITVSTYASAQTWAPRIGDQFGLVIVDEAHHVGAWCPADILEMLTAHSRLGLTATPPDGLALWSLSRRIGPTVYTLGIDALRGTALADFTNETVDVHLDPLERTSYRRLRGAFSSFYSRQQRLSPGLQWGEFVQLAQRSQEGRDALAAWRDSRSLLAYPAAKRAAVRELLQRHAGDRVLIFTADNATAYAIARELLVVPITCDIGRGERETMLARFRDGAGSVLVSAQVLEEGFDVPDAEVAIIVGGTGSKRRHAQRIGRVLRPRPGKQAHVYELAVVDSTEQRQVSRRHGRGTEPPPRERDPRPSVLVRRRAEEAPSLLLRPDANASRAGEHNTAPTWAWHPDEPVRVGAPHVSDAAEDMRTPTWLADRTDAADEIRTPTWVADDASAEVVS